MSSVPSSAVMVEPKFQTATSSLGGVGARVALDLLADVGLEPLELLLLPDAEEVDVGALGGRAGGLVERELDQGGLQEQPDREGTGEQERPQPQQNQPDGASSHAYCSS